MLLSLVSWGIIVVYSFVLGYGVLQLPVYRKAVGWKSFEAYIIMGLILETIYAQIFSLFSGVSKTAFIILSILVLGTAIALAWNSLRNIRSLIQKLAKLNYIKVSLAIFAIIIFSCITSEYCQHPDTALYHANAIRWIEEYGVVKGLGNLHFRFAYNSALMPLQALFSFQWLLGQSMHTLTGGVCCMFFLYACLTNHFVKSHEPDLTDFLRFSMILYIFRSRNTISSPGTDIITLLMVCYGVIKWYESIQKKENVNVDQTLLCVFVLWVISLKVSAALLILLVSIPFVKLIHEKRWNFIIGNVIFGLAVIIPWLIRNVLISGYLLYPLGSLDIFPVDWKIPIDILIEDSHYITTFGRETQRLDTFDFSLYQWFPVWWNARTMFEKGITVLGIIGLIFCVVELIKYAKVKSWENIVLYGTVIAALCYWFISAPLMRYGMMFLLITASLGLGPYLVKLNSNLIVAGLSVITLVIVCNLYTRMSTHINSKVYQMDYDKIEAYDVEDLSGYPIYIPQNRCASYELFPACPTLEIFDRLELRGTEIRQGFRMRER